MFGLKITTRKNYLEKLQESRREGNHDGRYMALAEYKDADKIIVGQALIKDNTGLKRIVVLGNEAMIFGNTININGGEDAIRVVG